jgi:hypothetical protein
MRARRGVGLIGALLLLAGLPGSAQDKGPVKLDVVKYDGLKEAVVKQRGKVVLIDFWGEF